MGKIYLEENVFEASKKRIEYLFSEFDNILVAFSGGKDSSVCLELCYDYGKKTNQLHKLAMYHIDYEAQYQATTDFVEEIFARMSEIKKFWLCLPLKAQCCCNIEDNGHWTPWESDKKEIWVRDLPTYDFVITEKNAMFEFKNKSDYEVQDNFCEWFENSHGKTAVVIGIRADESLNRFRAIASEKAEKYKNNIWINKNKAYPIYDWTVNDVWVFNAKQNKSYNKLYDLFHLAGLSPEQMRVASPFNDCASSTLKLYKIIDPLNWGKMTGRVNGVNFVGLYGGTTAMGWKSITKPAHFTWKQYCYFLLDTLDEKQKNHYLKKLEASKKSWINGGGIDEDTIKELEESNADCIITDDVSTRGQKNKRVVKFLNYLDDTNITNFKRIPTYKRMCICIIKNDYYCKYMGFAQTKNEIEKRQRAVKKWGSIL